MLCGSLRAAVVVARPVPRQAIAHRSARRPDAETGADERDGGSGVTCAMWSTGDPLGMFALPRVHVGAMPERLRPVPRTF